MFELLSNDIIANEILPPAHWFNGMGMGGDNLSPELHWRNAPEDSKSFVITLFDPDAPTGSGWWHWVVIDLPADCSSLPNGIGSHPERLPKPARMINNDFGNNLYGGAAPPPNDQPHRYIFTIFALKIATLDLPATATPAAVGFSVHFNCLAKAQLINFLSRP